MATGVKVGRAAHGHVRDQARKLATTYRKVLESPDGKFCANPDDDPEEQTWITESQALAHLVSALENFAETGIFVQQFDLKKFGIREAYKAEMLKGVKRAVAITKLMELHGMSKSVIERTIRSKTGLDEAAK